MRMKNFLDFAKEENMSLFTDFYELTMCASYFDNGDFEPATFDLFIRRLPENRSYILFAGLEQCLQYLQSIKFTEEQLAYLERRVLKVIFWIFCAASSLQAKFGLFLKAHWLFRMNP